MDGTASLKLTSVDASGGFTALVSIPTPGIAVSMVVGDKAPDFRISGQMPLSLSVSETRRTLVVGDGGSDEVLFDFPWWAIGGDRLSAFRLEKSQRWDEARSHLDLRMRYASPELGGSFDVSTPTPIASWLDTLPDPGPGQGWLLMKGAGNDQVRIDVTSAGGSGQQISVKVDFGGDGSVDVTGDGNWTDAGLISGYFFADYTPGGRGNSYAMDPKEFSLRAPFKASFSVAPQDALRVQFTRPPVDAGNWTWRLMDLGPLSSGPTAAQPVTVTVQNQGALVVIKPAQPLRYSRRYELLLDTGVPAPQGQLLRAATGGTLELHQGLVGGFTTLDHLNPLPAFVAWPLYLSATSGTRVSTPAQREGAPPATYSWAQVSGPPVVIATPHAAATDVTLGAGASGIGSATLRLTMALADGASESADIVIRTVGDISQPWASFLRVPGIPSGSREQLMWGGPAVGQLRVTGSGDRLTLSYTDQAGPAMHYPDWSLQLRTGDGAALKPGSYTNAWSVGAVGRPAGAHVLEFDMRSYGFMPRGSDFTILELETDGAGGVTRLALDFVVRGIGDFTPTTGSVRFNSARPLTTP